MRLYFNIHYANDLVYRGQTLEDWLAMPDEGVLVVTEVTDRLYGHPRKHAGERHAGRDYYWMDDEGNIGAGAAKYIPENVHIKRGQEVDSETWDRIYNLACIDPEQGTIAS